MTSTPQNKMLLTLATLTDKDSRPILLLHTAHLPSTQATSQTIAARLQPTLSTIPQSTPLTLVLLYAGFAKLHQTTTRAGVHAFRTAYETDQIVPQALRARVEQIVLVHVSVLTRAHIYFSSFAMKEKEYDKIIYCDLLSDLEHVLGVDSTLLGLEQDDFEYDNTMRVWVGRQHEHIPIRAPDPSKPLLDLNNVSTSWTEQPAPNQSRPTSHPQP